MKIIIINPNIVTQKGDFFGTGIPYMPIIPAYLASYLKEKGHQILIIDAFGEKPFQKRERGEFIIQGLRLEEISNTIERNCDLICLFAGHVVEHEILLKIIRNLKTDLNAPIVIIENSQAVTSYSLEKISDELFRNGADYIITGEAESGMDYLIQNLKIKKNRVIEKIIKTAEIKNLDSLLFPTWDLFPIKNYWGLGYSHAPFTGPYLPLLTSRGCPFNCQFCIIPFLGKRRWRARSAENIVTEIEFSIKKYGVREFHIEDLNPTIDKKRIEEICKLILKRKLNLIFKFASGIKLETIDESTLKLLKLSGCQYISFSPESGSKKVLDLMGKPFDYEHGIKMTRMMSKLGIFSQACFVLGFPGEKKEDLVLTKDYIKKLTKAGIDEIALFIMTPLPGSPTYDLSQTKPKKLSQLTFSPKWRNDYIELSQFRKNAYLFFMGYKLIYHPLNLIKQLLRVFTRNYKTKMEMTMNRLLKTEIRYVYKEIFNLSYKK